MVEMRMGDKNMVDHADLGEAELIDARSRIDQHVMIEQELGGAQIATDPAAAPQSPELHCFVTFFW